MKFFRIVFFAFLILILACDSETNSPRPINDQDRNLLLFKMNRDTAWPSALKKYDDYCHYIENEHPVILAYFKNYAKNEVLLRNSDFLLDKIYMNHPRLDSLKSINKRVNSLIKKFDWLYPNLKEEMNFVAHCGGFCEPQYNGPFYPILPDRKDHSIHYWSKYENQQIFSQLYSKLKSELSNLYAYHSNPELGRRMLFSDSILSNTQLSTSTFKNKTTAEVVLEFSKIQRVLIHLKTEILSLEKKTLSIKDSFFAEN